MSATGSASVTASVVIGCVGAPEGARACLTALGRQAAGAEVLVCSPRPVPGTLRAEFPWARWIERPDALVPELWRDGLDAASGDVVALTISPMLPAPDWLERAVAGALRHGAYAGAIDPAPGLPLSDLAECLCRYAKDLTPFVARDTADIPGDNCAYRTDLVRSVRPTWADGFWEPDVNRALADAGTTPRHDMALRVEQGRSAGPRAFLRQRRVHGRAHGRQRGARFSAGRNLAGAAAWPVVAPLLVLRTYQELARRSRLSARTLAALPWLVLFDVAWAVGEALGHADALRGR